MGKAITGPYIVKVHGPLPDSQNYGSRMRRECWEHSPRHRGLAIPTSIKDTCLTHVPWCMQWSLTSGFLWSQWRGKRSRHSRRMGNPQFYASRKRPMADAFASGFWEMRPCAHKIGDDKSALVQAMTCCCHRIVRLRGTSRHFGKRWLIRYKISPGHFHVYMWMSKKRTHVRKIRK